MSHPPEVPLPIAISLTPAGHLLLRAAEPGEASPEPAVGAKPAGPGVDALLDFSVALTLDGEPVTAAELCAAWTARSSSARQATPGPASPVELA